MSANSKIEWTDATWNPIVGCTRVSEGCMNCYAERFAARFPDRFGGVSRMTEYGPRWTGKIVLRPEALNLPLRWRKQRRIFVNSMSDLFHPDVPFEFVEKVFFIMAAAEHHTFQVLTKRPERMLEFMKRTEWREAIGLAAWPLPNVWLGVSVENQRAADERIPLLLQTPAAVRFLSCEPLLGPVMLTGLGKRCYGCAAGVPHRCRNVLVDWVIVGGESGPGARPMHPDWVRSIRDQCQAAGVAFHFKQWGEWLPVKATPGTKNYHSCADGKMRTPRIGDKTHEWGDGVVSIRVGKKAAGRLLDGRTWDELPVIGG